jgi:hypothetical protein
MVTTYNADLYLNGDLPEPYERATIEVKTCADSLADAIQKAKKWTTSAGVKVEEGAWLKIFLDGKCIKTFKPGEF